MFFLTPVKHLGLFGPRWNPQGTVLGPTLFLIYINEIAHNINSTIRLFADDSVLYRQINSPDDHRILQEDLQKLVEWSKTWQMEFNG